MTVHARNFRSEEADTVAVRGTLPIDRLTWVGVGVALLGWAVLLATLLLSDALLAGGSLMAVLSLRSDIVIVAQTAIGSGFALAMIGALRSGFGALNGFFDAVLQRSSAPRPAAPVAVEPEPVATAVAPIVPVRERAARPIRPGGHNYVILPDGSVEVDTLLGSRIFATLEEAKDFIH